MVKNMGKLCNVTKTRWGFYESMENGSREGMADYFETLFHHYQNRGKKIKELSAKLKFDCSMDY
jgi:hypothetical protein